MIGSKFRHAAGELDGGRIEVGEAPCASVVVNGDRKCVDHYAETALTFAQSCLRPGYAR
jgi:hypothetical protein